MAVGVQCGGGVGLEGEEVRVRVVAVVAAAWSGTNGCALVQGALAARAVVELAPRRDGGYEVLRPAPAGLDVLRADFEDVLEVGGHVGDLAL